MSMNIVNLLKRKTQSTHFIPEIDGLRFIAIITVLVFHLNSTLAKSLGLTDYGASMLGGRESMQFIGWWISRLDLGVKLFFSISGFILAVPFIQAIKSHKKIDIIQYYKRRLLRLEPPFIISLLVFFVIHTYILHTDIEQAQNHLFVGLLYLHGLIYGNPNPINPVTWSLEVEAQFYILVPALFAILGILKPNYMKGIVISLLILSGLYLKTYIYEVKYNHLYASVLFFITNFVTGIVFAYYYLSRDENWSTRKKYIWDIIALISIFSLFFFYKPQAFWWSNLVFNIAVFCLFVSAFKSIIFNKLMRTNWIYLIGGMCYSIYLLHYAMLHVVVRIIIKITRFEVYTTNLLFQLLTSLPIVLIISAMFFVLIEKPCMDKDWPAQLRNYMKLKLIKKKQ